MTEYEYTPLNHSKRQIRILQVHPGFEHDIITCSILARSLVDWNQIKVSNRLHSGISAFFRRPYWTRVWILQELVVAKHYPRVCCGSKSFALEGFAFIISELRPFFLSDTEEPEQPSGSGQDLEDLADARWDFWSENHSNRPSITSSLVDLLWQGRFKQASDDRDYVYGMLGLVNQG
jgi:hypothetical protein